MSILPSISVDETTNNHWLYIETLLLGGAASVITFSTGLSHDLYRVYASIDNAAATYVLHTFNNDAVAANYDSGRANLSSTTQTLLSTTAELGANIGDENDAATDSMHYFFLVGKPVAGKHGAWVGVNKQHLTSGIEANIGGGQWSDTGSKITRIDLVAASGTLFGAGTFVRLEGLTIA